MWHLLQYRKLPPHDRVINEEKDAKIDTNQIGNRLIIDEIKIIKKQ